MATSSTPCVNSATFGAGSRCGYPFRCENRLLVEARARARAGGPRQNQSPVIALAGRELRLPNRVHFRMRHARRSEPAQRAASRWSNTRGISDWVVMCPNGQKGVLAAFRAVLTDLPSRIAGLAEPQR